MLFQMVESEPTKLKTDATNRRLLKNIKRKLIGLEKSIDELKSVSNLSLKIMNDLIRITNKVQHM